MLKSGQAVALVLGLLLLLPVSAAEDRAPVEGEVFFDSVARVFGEFRHVASEAALNLSDVARAGEPLPLAWGSASGYVVRTEWTTASIAGEDISRGEPRPVNESFVTGASTSITVTCGPRCEIVLFTLGGGEGRLALAGTGDAVFQWTRERTVYWAEWSNGDETGFTRTFPAGSFALSTVPKSGFMTVQDGRAEAEGRIGMLVKDARIGIRGEDGTRIFLDALSRRSTPDATAGMVETVESRFAFMVLDDVSFSMRPSAPVDLVSRDPRVELTGGLFARDASGRLAFSDTTRSFRGEALGVEGRLVLLPTVEDDAIARPAGAALLGDETLRMRIEGEATRVHIGTSVFVAPGDGALAAGAGGVTLLGILWLLRDALLAPLYSRIPRRRVLSNANRERIYRLISEEPGVTAAEIRRRMGLARAVVQHHLRLLEAHRFILRHRDGRMRRCYAQAHHKEDASLAAHVVLQDPSRRRVAEALLSSGIPLSQKQLAARTGLSRRLVAYHLARLETAGVIVGDADHPRHYAAHVMSTLPSWSGWTSENADARGRP